MSNKNKKIDATDLFVTKGLDEMQVGEMYKTAYNCFKAFFHTNTAIVMAISLVLGLFLANDIVNIGFTVLLITGSVIALATSIIYVVFAMSLAKKGLMPPVFAKGAKKALVGTILVQFINFLGVLSTFTESSDFFMLVTVIPMYILIIAFIIAYLLARKNNKVLKQSESEE